MAIENPTDCGHRDPRPPAAEDMIVEAAVLNLVLEAPSFLTLAELVLAMRRGGEDRSRAEAVERAVRELVGAGLLHHRADLIRPSRAAVYLSELELS